MTGKNPFRAYRDVQIHSAGRIQSVLLLIEKALVFLKAIQADPSRMDNHVIKVQNILAQLEHSLNYDRGGVTGDLFYVYDYLFAELEKRDLEAVETARGMFVDLKATFMELKKRLLALRQP